MSVRMAFALLSASCLAATARADLDLDEFVKRPDSSFSWKVDASSPGKREMSRQWLIKLTSQTWQGKPWTHDLQIYEPREIRYPDAMVLYIGGGQNLGERTRFQDFQVGEALAVASGARVAVLPQVPNQPLLDGRLEDDLIAETFVRYLATRDADLPLLQPMVKSAVRAMDALQGWAKQEGIPLPRFVVTGASKRGWTTWLTGAVDPRVIAIAPMVIPTLNMKAQNKHQIAVWGKYSEQIEDYTRRGLMEKIEEPDGAKLWKLIDPFSYRDRLTLPKLQINGTNDPYWTLDSLNLYWDELKGPSHVVYLPNAGHDLKEHRDWAIHGVGALFRHAASGRKMPEFTWKPGPEDEVKSFRLALDLKGTTPPPKEVRFWMAESRTQDFRESRWQPRLVPVSESVAITDEVPREGFKAVFADLTFEIDGLEYHLSSQVGIFGPGGRTP